MNETKTRERPGVPASIYLETDESGEPRVVSNTPASTDPMARHVRRTLEPL